MASQRIGVIKDQRAHVEAGVTTYNTPVNAVNVEPNSGEDSVDCINRLTATFGQANVLVYGLPIDANGNRNEVGALPLRSQPT